MADEVVRDAVPAESRVRAEAGAVVVFHGTTLTRAGSILREGRLRVDPPLTWPGTTPGTVYVTLSVADALQYARLALTREGHNGPSTPRRSGYACVFAIMLSGTK